MEEFPSMQDWEEEHQPQCGSRTAHEVQVVAVAQREDRQVPKDQEGQVDS